MLTTRPPVLPSGSNQFSRSWLFGAVAPRIYLFYVKHFWILIILYKSFITTYSQLTPWEGNNVVCLKLRWILPRGKYWGRYSFWRRMSGTPWSVWTHTVGVKKLFQSRRYSELNPVHPNRALKDIIIINDQKFSLIYLINYFAG